MKGQQIQEKQLNIRPGLTARQQDLLLFILMGARWALETYFIKIVIQTT
tara:strand:+ start:1999 stop:2145 length:147 start_codon:yes stop_codon:yes gene_type:complete